MKCDDGQLGTILMREVGRMSLSGFTLFATGSGWQASVRRAGQTGWSVHIAPTADEAIRLAFGEKKEVLNGGVFD